LSRFVLSSHLNRHNVPDLEWLSYLWHCAERAGPTGRLWECCRGVTGRGVDMRTISSEISTKPGDSVPTCTIDPDRMAV
jgi:hypothetical protein